MSTKVIGYGIDFGSTNSLVSKVYPDKVEVLDLEALASDSFNKCLPSYVYFDRYHDHRVGLDAIQQYVIAGSSKTKCNNCSIECFKDLGGQGPTRRGSPKPSRPTSCMDARLAHGLKSVLANQYFVKTDSWGESFTIETMISWIIDALKSAANEYDDEIVEPLVIGVPVKYADEESGSRAIALDRMRNAAIKSGFSNVSFLEEPVAALISGNHRSPKTKASGPYCSVDFGGGTFDIAVSSDGENPWSADVVEGVAIGGELFDSIILTKILAKRLKWQKTLNDHDWLKDRNSVFRSASMSDFRSKISQDQSISAKLFATILDRGLIYEFWQAIESLKVELSINNSAHMDFHKRDIKIYEEVTRVEFDHAIKEEMREVRETMERAILNARITGEMVKRVIKTGGSSELPIFQKMLVDLFPNAVIESVPTLTTVAEGLGLSILTNSKSDPMVLDDVRVKGMRPKSRPTSKPKVTNNVISKKLPQSNKSDASNQIKTVKEGVELSQQINSGSKSVTPPVKKNNSWLRRISSWIKEIRDFDR